MGKNDIPEINLHIHRQQIFDKGAKIIEWRKETFPTNGDEITAYPYRKSKFGFTSCNVYKP